MNIAVPKMVDAPFHCPPDVVVSLPMPPSVNNLFPSNGKHRFKSREYKAWITEAGYALNLQKPQQIWGRVSILIELEESPALSDCSNFEKATVDLLVSHKLIQGDDRRYVRRNTQAWVNDIQGVRVTIKACA